MESSEDVELEVMFRTAFPGSPSADSYAKRLRALNNLGRSSGSDPSITNLRKDILNEICGGARFWSPAGKTLVVLSLASGILAIAGLQLRIQALYTGAGLLAFVLLVTMASLGYRDHVARLLSLADRIAIIERLKSEGLLLSTEVPELRKRVYERHGRVDQA